MLTESTNFIPKQFFQTDNTLENESFKISPLTQLFIAISNNDYPTLEQLVIGSPDIVNQQNERGVAPIYFATIKNNYKMVKLLLQHGANTEPSQLPGNMQLLEPLFAAILNGDASKDIFSLLCDNGANVNILSRDYYSSVQYALHLRRDKFFIEKLIQYKADCNIKSPDNESALEKALEHKDNILLVDLLINGGAEVNITTKKGDVLLHDILTRENHSALSLSLIKGGADVDIKDMNGNSFLHKICDPAKALNTTMEVLIFTLQHSYNVNATDSQGLTALQLLIQGIKTNNISIYYQGHEKEIIQMFINAGADFTVKDSEGRSPFDYLEQINYLNKDSLVHSNAGEVANNKATDTYLILHLKNSSSKDKIFNSSTDCIKHYNFHEEWRTDLSGDWDVDPTFSGQ
ncbi:MAG: serine/threonine-protein phosphatase 6 regulatory ankyrin repeat subunit B-like [Rickettsiaceae bacterium]|jgi:serine/threonine-protein phosphatase 6 regulatory ankyrin repeat subunit B|nr:serine/threonine-protein phosphatase 6 regulatory ankyrin repeat subunit B-like [Rickettsiaceae bacterium]